MVPLGLLNSQRGRGGAYLWEENFCENKHQVCRCSSKYPRPPQAQQPGPLAPRVSAAQGCRFHLMLHRCPVHGLLGYFKVLKQWAAVSLGVYTLQLMRAPAAEWTVGSVMGVAGTDH